MCDCEENRSREDEENKDREDYEMHEEDNESRRIGELA